MQTLPISKVKDKLNEYVDSVAITHDQVTITKNGSPAAVLIGADEWESIQETLFWLSQPGIRETTAEAEADIVAGRTHGENEIRAEFGVPKRDSWARNVAYDVQFTGPARRALQSIPPRVVPAIIEFAFGDLAREPHRVGKPLERELSGLFGARRGPYRLLYRIDDEAQRIYIVHVDHRADVYRPR